MTTSRKLRLLAVFPARLAHGLIALAIIGSMTGISGCGDDILAAEATTGCATPDPGSATSGTATGTPGNPGAEQGPAGCDQLPGTDRCSMCLKSNCCEAMQRCYEDARGCGCYAQCNAQAPGGIASNDAITCILLRGCTSPDLNALGEVLSCGRKCAQTGACKLPDLPGAKPGETEKGTTSTGSTSTQDTTTTQSTQPDTTQDTTSSQEDSTASSTTSQSTTENTTQETTSSQASSTASNTNTQSTKENTTKSTTAPESSTEQTTQESTSQATGSTDPSTSDLIECLNRDPNPATLANCTRPQTKPAAKTPCIPRARLAYASVLTPSPSVPRSFEQAT